MLILQHKRNAPRVQPRAPLDASVIAIVGHGRSPEGRGWGSAIDECCVVRMWNWDWQDPKDYGTRYDYGVTESHRKILRQMRECNKHEPSISWLMSILDCDKFTMSEVPDNRIDIRQEVWLTQEGRAVKGIGETGVWQLTRGGIAACWAISNCKNGAHVILIGFDVIKAGLSPHPDAAFSPRYQSHPGFWGIDGFKEGKTKEGNHDYPAERQLIELVAARKGAVKLSFAEDIWP